MATPINLNTLPADVHFVFDHEAPLLWTPLEDTSEEARLTTCAGCDDEGNHIGYTKEELAPCAAPGCLYRYCDECRDIDGDDGDGEFFNQINAWHEYITERANGLAGANGVLLKLHPHRWNYYVNDSVASIYSQRLPGWCVSCTLSTPSCPSFNCGMRSMVGGVCVSADHKDDDTHHNTTPPQSPPPCLKRKSTSPPPSSPKRVRFSPARRFSIDVTDDDECITSQ